MKESNSFSDSIEDLSSIKEKLKECGLTLEGFILKDQIVYGEDCIIIDGKGNKSLLPLKSLKSGILNKRNILAMFYCFGDAQRGLYNGHNIEYFRSQPSYKYSFDQNDDCAVLEFQDDKVFVNYKLDKGIISYCLFKASYEERGVVLNPKMAIEFPISDSQLNYKEEFLLAILVNVIWYNL